MEEEKVLAPELEEAKVQEETVAPAEEVTEQEAATQQEVIAPAEEAEKEDEESLADSVRIVSPGRLVAKRFFRSRLSMLGLVTLIVLFLFSFLGPVFSPWGEVQVDEKMQEDKRETYVYTTYVEELDESEIKGATYPGETDSDYAKFYTETLQVGYYMDNGEQIWFRKTAGADAGYYRCTPLEKDEEGNVIGGEIEQFTCVEYSWDHKPFNQLGKIDKNHWLGTDERGMDVFTRLMYGGRVSLTLGFVVVFLETFLGIIFGGLAGYFGKWVDQIIMRLVDIFNCIPQLPVMLILSAVFDGMGIDDKFKIYYMMGVLTLIGWSGIARVVRGQILFLREQEYMVAAEALGLSTTRKIVRHLVPNIMPQLIVQMTLGLGGIILSESTLSYLGIGIPIPYAAWGTMISSAQKPEILQNYPNLWIPAGILIVLAVLAFNFVGDGLRDAFDPKASR